MLNLKISQCTDQSRVPELIKHCNSVYDELRRDAMAEKPDGTRWQYNDLYKNPLEIQNFIKNSEMFVAEIDGCLAGCIRIICDEQRGSSSFQTLAVGPEFRGKKIAGELVAFAENLSKSKGYRFIECDVMYPVSERIFLHDWYVRLGYEETETIEVDDHVRYQEVRHMLKPKLVSRA